MVSVSAHHPSIWCQFLHSILQYGVSFCAPSFNMVSVSALHPSIWCQFLHSILQYGVSFCTPSFNMVSVSALHPSICCQFLHSILQYGVSFCTPSFNMGGGLGGFGLGSRPPPGARQGLARLSWCTSVVFEPPKFHIPAPTRGVRRPCCKQGQDSSGLH